jgi:hypothetical protein
LQQLWQALWFGGLNLRFRFLWLTKHPFAGTDTRIRAWN